VTVAFFLGRDARLISAAHKRGIGDELADVRIFPSSSWMISQLAPPRDHFFLPASFAAHLIPTEFIELIKYRTDLPTFFGVWVQFAQLLSQRDKFRA
jgi:hypothetical protein